jgi:sugar O-acyltransferase (sialic acid O-acetyltransferase NeuD family)
VLDNKIILIGYSGHGKVVADTALDCGLSIVGYAEQKIIENNPFHLKYIGYEKEDTFVGWQLDADFLIGIGDNNIREKVYNNIINRGREVKTLKSMTSIISKYSTIGNGTFVSSNVTVNASSRIGMNVILNTGCIVEHECNIENSVHIAPGAVLAGNVTIGERSFIGANAVLKQGIVIGKDVVVGAGAVVLHDIPDNMKIVGNPGRFI